MSAPTIVSEAEYSEAAESYTGFCTECKEFSREQTEPDADHYMCPSCRQYTVMGAEQALLLGLIEIGGDDGEGDAT